MNQMPNNTPFITLGQRLKSIRQELKQTLAEVSGAVEIDVEELNRMENGLDRPNEDILMLLMNHFGIQDNEAIVLWQLAGYDNLQPSLTGDDHQRPLIVMMALDARVIYSDNVVIDVNDKGMVINFTQSAFGNNGEIPVSRVGLSYQQASELIKKLRLSMLQAKYGSGIKLLEAPRSRTKKRN
jgi:transcriptional regulator with XRE-family HTH domain